jgi:hypothetical protein
MPTGTLAAQYSPKPRLFGKQIRRRRLQHRGAGVFLVLGFLFGDAGWLTEIGSQRSVIRKGVPTPKRC